MIYKKVNTADRLPEKGGQYHVIIELDEKEAAKLLSSTKGINTSAFFIKSKKKWYKKDRQIHIDYWLEPIDLPGEEEILDEAWYHLGIVNGLKKDNRFSFYHGAMWLLSQIKIEQQ